MFIIRTEKSSDIPAIGEVNKKAFKGPIETYLIDLLRETNKVALYLVAVYDERLSVTYCSHP